MEGWKEEREIRNRRFATVDPSQIVERRNWYGLNSRGDWSLIEVYLGYLLSTKAKDLYLTDQAEKNGITLSCGSTANFERYQRRWCSLEGESQAQDQVNESQILKERSWDPVNYIRGAYPILGSVPFFPDTAVQWTRNIRPFHDINADRRTWNIRSPSWLIVVGTRSSTPNWSDLHTVYPAGD